MNNSNVILITELGSVTCGSIADLSRSIAESLPIGQDQVACIIKSLPGSRVSNLSFTYCRNGSMYETYGSRSVLDFGILLSRIKWDERKCRLIDRMTCVIKGCRSTHTSSADLFCIRCYRSDTKYLSGNFLRRAFGRSKGKVQAIKNGPVSG